MSSREVPTDARPAGTPDSDPCQNSGNSPPAGSLPWSDHDRAEDKTRLFRYIAYSPEGTPLSKVVRDVFEEGGTGYSNTDYKFVKREVERYDYSTRFNSPEKPGEIQRKFRRAVDRGEERYGSACLLTLTTDRKRFSSVLDAVDEILENKGRLFDRLEYDAETGPTRPGYRVPHIYVPEFTDSGLIHLHVLCFGVNFLYPQSALSTLWDDLGQAEVVDIRALPERGGHFYMPRRSGDACPEGVRDPGEGSVRVRDYLSKTIRDLQHLADMSPEEVEETAGAIQRGEVEGRDADLWKLALYWACSRRFWNGSPEFTRDDPEEGDDLPHVPRYEYVGTARLEGFPAYILDRGVVLSRGRGPPSGRPPPDAGDAPSTGVSAAVE